MKKKLSLLVALLATCSLGAFASCSEEEPKHEHAYTESVVEPTHTADGKKTFTCECGDTYEEVIPATGHGENWGDWTVVTPADCVTKGKEKRTCSCGAEEEREIAIDEDGHDWSEWEEVTAATCTEKGSETRICLNECGVEAETREKPIVATAHTWTDEDWEVVTSATCQTKGSEKRVCECGEEETREIGLNADNHEWSVWKETKPASCEEEGLEERTCACGNVEKETRAIAKTSHVFENGACTGCGVDEKITWITAGTGVSDYEDGVWTVAANGGSQVLTVKAAAVNAYLDAGYSKIGVQVTSAGATFDMLYKPTMYSKNSGIVYADITEANRDQDVSVSFYFSDSLSSKQYTVKIFTAKAFDLADEATWLEGRNYNAGGAGVSYADGAWTVDLYSMDSKTGGEFRFAINAGVVANWIEKGATAVTIAVGSKSGQTAAFSSSISGTLTAANGSYTTTLALTESMASSEYVATLYLRAMSEGTTVDGFTVKFVPVIPANVNNKATWISGGATADATSAVEYDATKNLWVLSAERLDKGVLSGNITWKLDKAIVNALIEKGVTKLDVTMGAKEGEGFLSVWKVAYGYHVYGTQTETKELELVKDSDLVVTFYSRNMSESEAQGDGFEKAPAYTGYTITLTEKKGLDVSDKTKWFTSEAMTFAYADNVWTTTFTNTNGTRAFTLDKAVVNALIAKGVTSLTFTFGAKANDGYVSTLTLPWGNKIVGTTTESKKYDLVEDTALEVSFYTRALSATEATEAGLEAAPAYTGFTVTVTENTAA